MALPPPSQQNQAWFSSSAAAPDFSSAHPTHPTYPGHPTSAAYGQTFQGHQGFGSGGGLGGQSFGVSASGSGFGFQDPPAGNLSAGIDTDDEFANEPPLLEELGVNPTYIVQRVKGVLFFKAVSAEVQRDGWDLAGPLAIGSFLGIFLLLAGKLHFGYIYGLTMAGTLGIWLLANVMTTGDGIDMLSCLSILGYGLLPIVALSAIGLLANLPGSPPGIALSVAAAAWSTVTASRFLDTAVDSRQQRLLIAYPVLLVYGSFVLITIF